MVKAILFDLDDTLLWDEKSVKLAFEETCKIAEEKYSIDPVALEEKVRDTARDLYASYDTFSFTKKIGINPFEALWGEFDDKGKEFQRLNEIAPNYRVEAWTKGLQKLGVDDEVLGEQLADSFPVKRKKNPVVYEETYEILDELKNAYSLLLLTNGSPDVQQTKLELTPKLKCYFEHIVISGEFGSGKPDPAIFEYALNKLVVDKDEVLMVGDNLNTDILGANRAGIPSVWINRKQKERVEISPTYEIENLSELIEIV